MLMRGFKNKNEVVNDLAFLSIIVKEQYQLFMPLRYCSVDQISPPPFLVTSKIFSLYMPVPLAGKANFSLH